MVAYAAKLHTEELVSEDEGLVAIAA